MSKRNIVVAVFEVEGTNDDETDSATDALLDELRDLPDNSIEQVIEEARDEDRPVPNVSIKTLLRSSEWDVK